MIQPCELIEMAPQPTLCMRVRTSVAQLPGVLGGAFKTINEYLGSFGKLPCGAPYVAYYNMDMDDLDIEVGYPVEPGISGDSTIKAGEIPSGRYGTTTFVGPYQEMSAAYEAFNMWSRANKYEPTGTVYEVYLNEPGKVLPHQLQTKILFPLK